MRKKAVALYNTGADEQESGLDVGVGGKPSNRSISETLF
jgi:hypothetical protein